MRWIRRKTWDRAIDALDPVDDAQEIVTLMVQYVFPVEFLLAMEIAQFRTFSIPSISELLHATRQYESEGVKRLDDTRAIISEIYSTPKGTAEQMEMIEHLNAIHGLYTIDNDDYLYTLSTFMLDPSLFLERFGFRELRPNEKQAMFEMYRELREHMGIEDIPDSFDAMLRWRRAYEDRAQTYAPSNEAVAQGMLRAVKELVPKPLRPLVEPMIAALLEERRLLDALGLRAPPAVLQRSLDRVMALQAFLVRYINVFEVGGITEWAFFTQYPSYPKGYERLKLGPRRVIEILERRRARKVA